MRIHVPLRLATLLSLGLFFVMAGSASAHATIPAHAKVYKAIPAIGSTVPQAPTSVTVFTLENMKPGPKLSNLFVYAPTGELISQGNATVALNDPKQMSVNIKPSGNGVYVVHWITVSADDGDPDEGAFVFTVGSSAVVASHNPGTTSGTAGSPIWVPIAVGVLALLIGLGGGFGLGRRNASTRPAVSRMRRELAEEQEDPQATPRR